MNYQVIVKKYNDEYILYIKELSLIHKSKDLEISEDSYLIYCDQNDLHTLNEKVIEKFGETKSSQLIWRSENNINIKKDNAEKLFKLLNTLEDNEDVQNVSSNFDVSEEVLHSLTK